MTSIDTTEPRPGRTAEEQYLALLQRIMNEGVSKGDRTGTGMVELFGVHLEADLSRSFPLLTTKKVWWKGVVAELLWMIRGGTNVKDLHEHDVHIWDEWADENGELGPVYGRQWRSWVVESSVQETDGNKVRYNSCVDQLQDVISEIAENPNSRRLLVSAWNVGELDKMRLPPCHVLFQFCVQPDTDEGAPRLHCHMYQRSADFFLGVPFNLASYALLTHLVAHVTGLRPGRLTISFGSAHVYKNHVEQVEEQLTRQPRALPRLDLEDLIRANIESFTVEGLVGALKGYDPHPPIKAPIAV